MYCIKYLTKIDSLCPFFLLQNDEFLEAENESLKCPECSFIAESKQVLTHHVQHKHFSVKVHTCLNCPYTSRWKSDITKHARKKHPNKLSVKEKFICNICELGFSRRINMKQHKLKTHGCDGLHECKQCEYTSSRKSDLTKHVRSVHLNQRPHACRLCSYSGAIIETLDKHLIKKHNFEINFTCDMCFESFTMETTFSKHKLLKHNFSKKTNLDIESSNEFMNEEPHTLDKKEIVMLDPNTDKKIEMINIPNENELVCSICWNFKTFIPIQLEKHIKELHGLVKPQILKTMNLRDKTQKFICKTCSTSFTRNSDLKRHIQVVHHGEKTHLCNHCSYMSSRSSDLKRHVRAVHEHQKSFKCEYCEYSTAHKHSLKKHLVIHHSLNTDQSSSKS